MPKPIEPRNDESPDEWGAVVERALAGERAAYVKLARLVTGHLSHWRAYDFRADWDDIVQEVLISAVRAHKEGRVSAPGALPAFVRQATRFKFIDRIRASKRRTFVQDPSDSIDRAASPWPPGSLPPGEIEEMRIVLSRALELLPERARLAVCEVYIRGRTYEEAAELTGIPLGSLKRALREGLAQLRATCDSDP